MIEKITTPLPLEPAIDEIQRLLRTDLPKKSLFYGYQPKPEWFLRKEAETGIHGTSHLARVLILQEILSTLLIKEGVILDQNALRWAAVTHDIRRADDLFDPQHPQQAAQWALQNLRDGLSPTSIDKVAYINRRHSSRGKQVPEITPELAVLKDADALDRIRLGEEYFDPNHLHHEIAKKLLVKPAEALFRKTNERQGQNEPLFNYVIDCAAELGLVVR